MVALHVRNTQRERFVRISIIDATDLQSSFSSPWVSLVLSTPRAGMWAIPGHVIITSIISVYEYKNYRAGSSRNPSSLRAGVSTTAIGVQAGALSLLNDPYLPSGAGAGVFSTPPLGTARLFNIAEDLSALLSPLTSEGVMKF